MPTTTYLSAPAARPLRQYCAIWKDVWWAQATAAERRRILLEKLDAVAPLPADHFFNHRAS